MALGYVDSFRFVTQRSGIFPHLLTDFSDTGFSVEVLQATQHRFFRNRFFRNKFFRYKFFTIQSAKKQIQNPKSRSKIKMLKNCKHCEQNIKVEITKKICKVWLINAFGKNLEESLKRRWKKILRECCLHLLGLREAAPTTNNTKYFTHHFELKWLIRSTKHLVYKHLFCEVTPRQKMKHKKWKTSSTVSKISKLKSPKKLQSLAHKGVW